MKKIHETKHFNVYQSTQNLEFVVEQKMPHDCALWISIIYWDEDTRDTIYEDIDFRTVELMQNSRKRIIKEYGQVCDYLYELIRQARIQQNMKYIVINAWEKEQVCQGTREDCMNFILNEAKEQNFGIYRTWENNGVKHYDCGPRTYIIKEERQYD